MVVWPSTWMTSPFFYMNTPPVTIWFFSMWKHPTIKGQTCHGCITHDTVVYLCPERLMRLSYYIYWAYRKSFCLSRESNPGSLDHELFALAARPRLFSKCVPRFFKYRCPHYRQIRLASNYSKLFEITTIWIEFWFEYLRIALGIQIRIFFWFK